MTQTAGFKTETTAEVYRPFAMVQLDLPGGTERYFSGIGQLSWNGQTWTGAGDLGYVGKIESGTDLRAGSVDIGLSGLDASVKSDALNEATRGSDVYIYLGFFSDDANTIVADPWLAFFGSIDTTQVSDDEDGVSIALKVLDGVGARLRRTVRRRTDADQQEIYSGDKIFEFAASLRDPQNWGGPAATPRGTTGGGGGDRGNSNGVSPRSLV